MRGTYFIYIKKEKALPIKIWQSFFKDLWHFFFSFERFYLFLERGEERERNINVPVGWLSHAPNWGPGLQPRHVPWLGIKLVTFWFVVQHSIHWTTPARAKYDNMLMVAQTKAYPLSLAFTFLSFVLRDLAVSPAFSFFAWQIISNPFVHLSIQMWDSFLCLQGSPFLRSHEALGYSFAKKKKKVIPSMIQICFF